jgi:hypothetical protein
MRLGGDAEEGQLLRSAIQAAACQAWTEESDLRRAASTLTLIYHMLKDWTPSITSLNSPGWASTSNYSPQPEHTFRVLAWTRIQSVRSAASDPGRTRPTTQS